MKNLRVEFHVTVYETTDDKFPSGSPLLNIIEKDYITDAARLTSTHEQLSEMVLDTIKKNTVDVQKALAKLNPPLTQNRKELEERIQKELSELFPGYHFSGYWSGDLFRICNISGGIPEKSMIDITHPKAPNQQLTTMYPQLYQKLTNGRWSYAYQMGGYYKGVVKYIRAPINESKLKKYFKNLGIEYQLSTQKLEPLPEPKKHGCECDHHRNEYGL